MVIFIVCTTLLDITAFKNPVEAYAVCEMVAAEAERQRVDPALAVGLAFHESGMRPYVVSRVGAVGPLQVMPRYYPPDIPKNPKGMVQAGITLFKRLLDRGFSETDAVARYNGGNKPGARSYRWVRAVLKTTRILRGEK